MKVGAIAMRFLVPGIVITGICYLRFRAMVSPRAEVELSKHLSLGRKIEVGSFVKIKSSGGPLTIGERVIIATGCFISADKGGVEIGDDSMIGPNCSVIGNDYKYDRLDIPVGQQDKTSKGIRIGKDVWLGAGCVVTDGVTIGDHCIVAPNSVITKSLPPRSIAMGSPAKSVFERR